MMVFLLLFNLAVSFASLESDPYYLNISDDQLLDFLEDPGNRTTRTFAIYDELKDDVSFWFKIYAKYSSYHIVVYDKSRPSVVYDVIDTRDLLKLGKSAANVEITSKIRLKKSLIKIKTALKNLARHPRKTFTLDSDEAKLQSLWGRQPAKKWKEISGNIRSQTGQRDQVIAGINKAEPFIPAMESIFRKQKLPPELVRVPLLESSFNINAISSASAVGVWQFLEKSASEHLIVDKANNIDERLSPIKSTYAAAKLFIRNYRMLNDHALTLIAYNHGQKNLVLWLKKHKTSNFADLLDPKNKKSPLGYASRNYYSEFIAILHAEKYRDKLFGMKIPDGLRSGAVSIIRIIQPSSIFDIAATYGLSLGELRLYNPDIFDLKKKFPAGTRVVIPRTVANSLVQGAFFGTGESRSPAQKRMIEFEFVDYLE